MLNPRLEGLVAMVRQLYRFMSPMRRRQSAIVFALMVVGSLAELVAIGAIVPFLSLLAGQAEDQRLFDLDWLYDALGADGRQELLLATTGLFMLAAIVAGALRLQLAWSSQRFVLGLGHDLAVEIQRRTLLQPYSYHLSRNSSAILASLQKVQDLVSGVLLRLMQAATAAFIAIFIIAALIRIDPVTAAIAATAFSAIYALVSLVTRKRLAEYSRILGTAYEQRVQIVQESLGGIRDVIIDHSEAVYLDEFRKVDRRFALARANTAFIALAPRFVIEAAGMVVIAAIALIISNREGSLAGALPIVGALALGAQRLLPLMQQLYQGWSSLAGNRSIIGQVMDLLALPVGEEQLAPALAPLPLEQHIRLDGISFTYPGRRLPAVADIGLTIPQGSRVALVGRTGSGKSTLADLIMGLLEPGAGRIEIDGVALTRDNRRAWQQSIAHVPQAIFLADTSIARNIAFGVPSADIDQDRVAQAAAAAQLHEFVESLPDGYHTRVGERGVRLSGGQRQRLGIARAIYKDAPVLILDEATSALDHATEAALMSALDQLGREGRTIMIVAHRKSTVETCDLIARIDNGRLVETGSFAEIFDKPGRRSVART